MDEVVQLKANQAEQERVREEHNRVPEAGDLKT
jgi:hypothetical protein